MISNIGDYLFMGMLILFVLISLIILYSKTSGSLEIGITVLISIVVLTVGIGTFFLGNYINMLSMSGIIFIVLCILVGGIIVFSNELTIESFSTMPIGYQNQDGSFIPTFQSCIGNLTNTENNQSETNNRENNLETEIEQAKESCSRISGLQEELQKYQDDNDTTNFAQGPCIYGDGEAGMKLLSKGNICLPLEAVYSEDCSCSGKDSEQNNRDSSSEEGINQEDLNNCMSSLNEEGNGNMTGCYSKNSDFNEICKENYGQLYDACTISKCPTPFVDKYRSSCELNIPSEESLNSGKFKTSCYNYYVPLDDVCKSLARKNNKINFQKYGVKKYISCGNNKRKAVCSDCYKNGLPTHPTNTTTCESTSLPNLNYKFRSLCKSLGNKINQDLVPYNIKPYDCSFGKMRAECISKDLYNKIKNEKNFYKEVFA